MIRMVVNHYQKQCLSALLAQPYIHRQLFKHLTWRSRSWQPSLCQHMISMLWFSILMISKASYERVDLPH